jgi:processive 1,2-diacylglycerol beta-glucosyltransferase
MNKITIAMIEVGYGHKGPALALQRALQDLLLDSGSVEVVDFPRYVGAFRSDRSLKNSWDMALKSPFLVRGAYVAMEALYPRHGPLLRLMLSDFFTLGGEYLRSAPPDLFIATHPLCAMVATAARRRYNLDFPVASLVVDPFDAYSLWADRAVDGFFVHSAEAHRRLLQHRIPEDRIKRVPYPQLPAMEVPQRNREEIRHEYGVGESGRPVALVTSGAQGIGKVYGFVKRAFREGFPMDFLVVTGKNEDLYRDLSSLVEKTEAGSPRLISLSYVKNMGDLYAACDVVLGKAGASTFMEALRWKLPMVFTEWAGQNDYLLLQYAVQNGVGWYAPRYGAFIRTLASLAASQDRSIAQERMDVLDFRFGTDEIADRLLQLQRNFGGF